MAESEESLDDLRVVSAPPEAAGERLDKWLAAELSDLSRTRVQALIDEGAVTLDGVEIKDAKHKVRAHGAYEIAVPPPLEAIPIPQSIPLDVLFEDEHLIVLNKPAGLSVHPGPGHADGTLVNALLHHCAGQLSGIGGVARPGIVHRLDMDTSGVMVAAKTDKAHQGLAKLFAKHDIERRYMALVRGGVRPRAGTIHTNIGRAGADRQRVKILPLGASQGKEAITHYETAEIYGAQAGAAAGSPAASLIHCTLETGRTHQIRAHLSHSGAPVLGDALYAGQGAFKPEGESDAVSAARDAVKQFSRQALHAALLGFVHPVTKKKRSFDAEPPADFQTLRAALSRLPVSAATGRRS
ncbi:MAG: RluA family pseudouridine synthase [Caulobacterales bacterium]